MLHTGFRPCARAALLVLTIGLTACAGTVAGYPSLAPRPIEQMSLAEPATPPAPSPVADPVVLARSASTIDRARTADADFQRVLDQARFALAKGRGAAIGSDPWAAAQVALSRIEAAREPMIKELADLDSARDAERTQTNSAEALAATQAFETVQQIDLAERDALATAWPNNAGDR
jgi:hypothetical protein